MKPGKIILIAILLLVPFTAFSQIIGSISFYEKIGSPERPASIVDKGKIENAKWCTFHENGEEQKLSPSELLRYGLSNGTLYYSREILINGNSKEVFLELITAGDINLFYYKNKEISTFFIELEDSDILEVPRKTLSDSEVKSYKDILKENMADNETAVMNCKTVAYTRESIKRLIVAYNSNSTREIERIRIGLIGGFMYSSLHVRTWPALRIYEDVDYGYTASANIGISLNVPLPLKNFSFYTEVYYNSYKYFGQGLSTSSYLNSHGEINQISMPLMMRYNFHIKKSRPFFGAGLVFSYVESKNALYRSQVESGIAMIYRMDDFPTLSKFQTGICVGTGFEIPVFGRSSLSFEGRYNYILSQSDAASLNVSSFQFITGLNF